MALSVVPRSDQTPITALSASMRAAAAGRAGERRAPRARGERLRHELERDEREHRSGRERERHGQETSRSPRRARTRPRRRPAAARSWPRRPRTAATGEKPASRIGIADAVPSGMFCSAIASSTNTPSPSRSDANAVPIAKPSGRLWTSSTPNTSTERRTPAPRSTPTCTSRLASARRATEQEQRRPRAGPPRDLAARTLVQRRLQQADDRRYRHHARGDAPQQRAQPVGALAEREHRDRAEPRGEGGARAGEREQDRARPRRLAAAPARLEQLEQLGQQRHPRVRAQAGVGERGVGELGQRGLEVLAGDRRARPGSPACRPSPAARRRGRTAARAGPRPSGRRARGPRPSGRTCRARRRWCSRAPA